MEIEILLLVFFSISGVFSLQNAEVVEAGEFCYVAAIWVDRSFTSEYHCSGVILSKGYILTAGHCVHDIEVHKIIVMTNVDGHIFLEHPVNYVDTIILHPNFRRVFRADKPMTEYWINDIAILKLMCVLELTPTLVAVGLDLRHYYKNNGDDCFIAGWNPVMTNNKLHLILGWADAMVFRNGNCRSNSFLLPNEIYAFLTDSGALMDDMDTGNALICEGKAVGIIVGGRDRTRSVMTVLTIAPYKKFIDASMATGYGESID